jgi:Zn-dependent protease with chaperone function/Zn-finger nucleic acid-binding protein
MGPHGVLVEVCFSCGGLWLERGQIYHYVSDPQEFQGDVIQAYKSTVACSRLCPRCQVKMLQAKFPAPGPVFDICPRCGGNWFEEGQVRAVQDLLDRQLVGRHAAPAPRSEAPAQPALAAINIELPPPARPAPQALRAAAASLAGLPSLAFRSGAVLFTLYGILLGVCAILIPLTRLPIEYVFGGAFIALVASFLLSPFLMDISLRWFHAFHWANPEDLPEHLRGFINGVCKEQGIPFPRLGVIEDQNPNAFTYGHYPGDARLVVTQGVLDMLDAREIEAVAGHELGHIVHWDMLVMTTAALVPMACYVVYKFCFRIARSVAYSRKGDVRGLFLIPALLALILYYTTEYICLFLSRTRELYADRFSGETTGDPNSLSGALVKIAYGLAGNRGGAKQEEYSGQGTMRAMGIFDPTAAMGLAAASMSRTGAPSREAMLGAMRWDLWNPWAGYYELQSTHPLPAHRIDFLGRQAEAYGQAPLVRFDLKAPESYWEEFFADLAVLWLPWFLAAAAAAYDLWRMAGGGGFYRGVLWWNVAAAWAAGDLLLTSFSYRSGFSPDMNVGALLKKIKVSRVRGVPAALKGRIIGRGVPGYILSEHLVLQDETGFILLDYRQPLSVFQWIFALESAPGLIGGDVEVTGWYRRAPVPYLELRTLVCGGEKRTCYYLEARYAFAFLLIMAAIFMMAPK